ncbi:MAG TPA: HEPN domain-containing protein [Myxococcales bacterium]|nr:HEPN domain-containing protein [Myxococcales bacterium]
MTEANAKALAQAELARARSNLEAARMMLAAGKHGEAISLAYYASFHAVRAVLAARGLQPKTHQGAVHLFNVSFVLPGLVTSEILALIGRSFAERQRADYDPVAIFTADDAAKEIDSAERVLITLAPLAG